MIFGIVCFRKIILESLQNVSETTPKSSDTTVLTYISLWTYVPKNNLRSLVMQLYLFCIVQSMGCHQRAIESYNEDFVEISQMCNCE